ncbi:MAG: SNF2-related protein [Clostridia bacterium]|nr:SNF2-related protein [Clostridia bacterium]
MKLYQFQEQVLKDTEVKNKVAYYLDMGLGKTFVGAEKMIQLGANINLVICQKSKIDDWIEHFEKNYPTRIVIDLTKLKPKQFIEIQGFGTRGKKQVVLIINYELAFRRKELLQLKDFTLMLDESSMIQNETAKRTKFILKLQPKNIILLSGTPTSGKYENLISQIHLLGWKISKDLFYRQYIDYHYDDNAGFPIMIIDGYKNVERLKTKLREYGAVFMKTEEVFDLPDQIFNIVSIDTTKEYRKFKKDKIVSIGEKEFVGDTILTKMLYERMLCGSYNPEKLEALKDLITSTEDRLIVFYNFNEELRAIEDICLELDRPLSIVNGQTKDLSCYEEYENSITAIQYQAGAMGLNLQKANKIVYFTLPLSSELFEQSKKRTHRIGQGRTCFYYWIICKNSIEEKILATLKMRKDYTDDLFKEEE